MAKKSLKEILDQHLANNPKDNRFKSLLEDDTSPQENATPQKTIFDRHPETAPWEHHLDLHPEDWAYRQIYADWFESVICMKHSSTDEDRIYAYAQRWMAARKKCAQQPDEKGGWFWFAEGAHTARGLPKCLCDEIRAQVMKHGYKLWTRYEAELCLGQALEQLRRIVSLGEPL